MVLDYSIYNGTLYIDILTLYIYISLMVSIAGVEPGPHGGQIPLDGADHAERQDLGRRQNRC